MWWYKNKLCKFNEKMSGEMVWSGLVFVFAFMLLLLSFFLFHALFVWIRFILDLFFFSYFLKKRKKPSDAKKNFKMNTKLHNFVFIWCVDFSDLDSNQKRTWDIQCGAFKYSEENKKWEEKWRIPLKIFNFLIVIEWFRVCGFGKLQAINLIRKQDFILTHFKLHVSHKLISKYWNIAWIWNEISFILFDSA